MDFGAFTSGLLTGLREGVEAALIVGDHLRLPGQDRQPRSTSRTVFVGAGLALGLSAILGIVLFVVGRQLRGAVRAAVRRR